LEDFFIGPESTRLNGGDGSKTSEKRLTGLIRQFFNSGQQELPRFNGGEGRKQHLKNRLFLF